MSRGCFDAYRGLSHAEKWYRQDLGADHFDRRSTEIKAKRLAAQIKKLGLEVEIRPSTEAA